MSSLGVSPSWTYLPDTSANMTAPAEYTSQRESTSRAFPSACSGDMKPGVPRGAPVRVAVLADPMSRILAISKSNNFSWPPSVRKMFSG
jgi:hypothetical protein